MIAESALSHDLSPSILSVTMGIEPNRQKASSRVTHNSNKDKQDLKAGKTINMQTTGVPTTGVSTTVMPTVNKRANKTMKQIMVAEEEFKDRNHLNGRN